MDRSFYTNLNIFTKLLKETKHIRTQYNILKNDSKKNLEIINYYKSKITNHHENIIKLINNIIDNKSTIDIEKYNSLYSFLSEINIYSNKLEEHIDFNLEINNKLKEYKNTYKSNKIKIRNYKKLLNFDLIKGKHEMY